MKEMTEALVPKGYSAVMAQRIEPADSLDDFPTPPWATRALCEHVLDLRPLAQGGGLQASVLEPAAGRGHMAWALKEYFSDVTASDIHDYGSGFGVRDFLNSDQPSHQCDWIITNPPFRLAEAFALRALEIGGDGVALFARIQFMESVGRFNRLFGPRPPAIIAPFTERVPLLKGRLDRKGSTATSYAWFVWRNDTTGPTRLKWIPPCRRALERDGDYLS